MQESLPENQFKTPEYQQYKDSLMALGPITPENAREYRRIWESYHGMSIYPPAEKNNKMHKYHYSIYVSEDGKEFFKVYGRSNHKERAKAICLKKSENFPYREIKSFNRENY